MGGEPILTPPRGAKTGSDPENPAGKEKFVIRPAIRDQKRAFSLQY